MPYEVTISQHVADKAATFGPERTAGGKPSEYDFFGGPMAAAVSLFAAFDDLPEAAGPAVRSATTVDPIFGVVVFIGVHVEGGRVEIADFAFDPDYWLYTDGDDG
jgi:hypothetical protein